MEPVRQIYIGIDVKPPTPPTETGHGMLHGMQPDRHSHAVSGRISGPSLPSTVAKMHDSGRRRAAPPGLRAANIDLGGVAPLTGSLCAHTLTHNMARFRRAEADSAHMRVYRGLKGAKCSDQIAPIELQSEPVASVVRTAWQCPAQSVVAVYPAGRVCCMLHHWRGLLHARDQQHPHSGCRWQQLLILAISAPKLAAPHPEFRSWLLDHNKQWAFTSFFYYLVFWFACSHF